MFRPIVFRDGTGSDSRRSYFFRRRFALSCGLLLAASLPEEKRRDAQDQDKKRLHFRLRGAWRGPRRPPEEFSASIPQSGTDNLLPHS